MEEKTYRYRHLARVTVEADTPIAIGTGSKDIFTDAPVIRDINGLPYIPATSMAGVIRHALGIADNEEGIFGHHDKRGGLGSMIVFTDAVMMGKDGKVLDGIQEIPEGDEFYDHYRELNIRQHVRICPKGVADDNGKFDNEVVYKGTRFVFEIELVSCKEREEAYEQALSALYGEAFRIGGGTRCGYGKLKIISCKRATLDLEKMEDLDAYVKKSSCLASCWEHFKEVDVPTAPTASTGEWVKYTLHLQPRDFFLIGSGMGDEEADNTPMKELEVEWDKEGKPQFSKKRVLIPASSVKGALAHRTAYYYNRSVGNFADNMDKDQRDRCVGSKNKAVSDIFGRVEVKKESKDSKRGEIILSDVFGSKDDYKVFHHNKIDYFTGGTIDGALFQEKSVYGKGDTYDLEILVSKEALSDDKVKEAFENSLHDLCDGLLPLGGATGRGNGIFEGQLFKDGELCAR